MTPEAKQYQEQEENEDEEVKEEKLTNQSEGPPKLALVT